MKTLSVRRYVKMAAVFLSIFLCAALLRAQDITGQWNGVLSVQGVNLRLVLHVNKTGDGYTSTMDSPDQGAKGMPLSLVMILIQLRLPYKNRSIVTDRAASLTI